MFDTKKRSLNVNGYVAVGDKAPEVESPKTAERHWERRVLASLTKSLTSIKLSIFRDKHDALLNVASTDNNILANKRVHHCISFALTLPTPHSLSPPQGGARGGGAVKA